MAIANPDGSILLKTQVDESGVKKGLGGIKKLASTTGKAFLAVSAAVGAATVAITKMAVSAYADYEQLVGGIETLFKGSAKKVLEYANEAYKTTGLSANEYMRNVTSFSASLLSAVGGDTEKAAEVANAAMISISDNVNKMGSSAESVQLAFQGFAKQQYMLLDNLKLGYGGTKGEMERLLKDAQAITGVKYDIDNLADVYTAIGVIQEKLGIAGTTAKEAATTISGSAATMKAAWQNVLAAISGGGDLDRAIENLVDSVSVYFENIVPVFERALSGIGKLVENVAPKLIQTVAKSLIKAIPNLLRAIYDMIIGLAKGIYQGILDLFRDTTNDVLKEQSDNIRESAKNQKELTAEVEATNDAMKKTTASFDTVEILSSEIADNANEEISIPEIIGEEFGVSDGMEENIEDVKNEVLSPFVQYIKDDLAPRLAEAWNNAINSMKTSYELFGDDVANVNEETIQPALSDIGEFFTGLADGISETFSSLTSKISEYKEEIETVIDFFGKIISIFWNKIKSIVSFIVDVFKDSGSSIIKLILNIISALGNFIDVWKNIIGAIVSIFKGDFESAKEYFSNALSSFVNLWIGIANAIINVINLLWSGIFNAFKSGVNFVGGIISTIAGWFGADWDLHWDAQAPLIPEIPKYIPKLARGAVIPPNREFLAVLGDQKEGTNIEAPLQTIVDAFNIALDSRGTNEEPIIIELNGRELGRAVLEEGDRERRRIGSRLVVI